MSNVWQGFQCDIFCLKDVIFFDILYNKYMKTTLIYLAIFNLFAQAIYGNPILLSIPQESCIDGSDKENLNYIKNTQCFERQTFSEINAKKPRVPKKTDLPSCEEFVHFAHRVDMESKTLSIDEFDKKYLTDEKNQIKNPLSLNHPFFDKSKKPKPKNTLTNEENVLLNLMAMEASKDITTKIQTEIKLYGFEKAKSKFKDTYGLMGSILLNINSPEEFVKEFAADKIMSIFVKEISEPRIKVNLSFKELSKITSAISQKTWLKESFKILDSPVSSGSYNLFKTAIKRIKVRFSPAFINSLVIDNGISLFTTAESFDWIENKDEKNSFVNKPELFSAFAANFNFKIGEYSCEQLYLRFCNYYYSFACEKGEGHRDRVRYSFLENYISLRSQKVHQDKVQKEASTMADQHKLMMHRESTNVVKPSDKPK